jgi:hypothetical protein
MDLNMIWFLLVSVLLISCAVWTDSIWGRRPALKSERRVHINAIGQSGTAMSLATHRRWRALFTAFLSSMRPSSAVSTSL